MCNNFAERPTQKQQQKKLLQIDIGSHDRQTKMGKKRTQQRMNTTNKHWQVKKKKNNNNTSMNDFSNLIEHSYLLADVQCGEECSQCSHMIHTCQELVLQKQKTRLNNSNQNPQKCFMRNSPKNNNHLNPKKSFMRKNSPLKASKALHEIVIAGMEEEEKKKAFATTNECP
jgi:hypothetical protein